ncbi:hypothetical protein PSTT_09033, partial [Puccinia striiformis]
LTLNHHHQPHHPENLTHSPELNMKITIFLAALSVASGVLAASSKTGAKAAKEESTNMTRAYDDSAAPEAKRAGK